MRSKSVLQPWKTAARALTDAENEFRTAKFERKQRIIIDIGYNPVLRDGKLDIQAKELVAAVAAISKIPDWSG